MFLSGCIAWKCVSVYISNSEVMSVSSETHFSDAENFTKNFPVLYPLSALGTYQNYNHEDFCWWMQGEAIMLMISCPPLTVPVPFQRFSMSCIQNSIWEFVQHNSAADFPAFRALRFAGGLKGLLNAVNQDL